MALTKITRGLLNTGVSDSSDATAITINSSELVTFAAGITSTAAANTLGATSFNEADLTNVGTIYADQYLGDADTDSGIVLPGSDIMTLHTANSERMRIDADGNFSLGGGANATNFSNYVTLDLRDTTGGLIDFSEASAGVFARIQAVVNNSLNINNRQAYPLTFGTNDTERMRIASDGNIGIGTTDAGNAKLVINGAIGSGADTACIDFDGYGTYSEGSSQSINFRMGRVGQATDQAAQIRSIFQGGGATAGQTSVGFEFRCISNDTVDTTVRFSGTGQRIQFNTDEIPQSGNPITNQAIVIGESSSGAITQGLTNATVLQNRSGELYAIDSSHNNTQITPHNWGLISSGPSEELAWTYYSQRPNPSNSEQMQTINCDMAKVIRKVEDLVGEKLIYTENSDKDGHTFQTIISDIQTTLADLKTRVEALEG